MSLKFLFEGYEWSLREGGPHPGSRERDDPTFHDALQAAHPALGKLTLHEISSWIVARLDYITCGSLALLGDEFSHDSNNFSYKIKLADQSQQAVAQGALMFEADRVHFFALDLRIESFQSLLVRLLTDAPQDLSRCDIIVRLPESKRKRHYGWNGYSLLNH